MGRPRLPQRQTACDILKSQQEVAVAGAWGGKRENIREREIVFEMDDEVVTRITYCTWWGGSE